MDRCRFFGLLSSYIDGELQDKQRLELEEHLKTCVSCNKEVSMLKALSGGLKKWQVPELDKSFDRTVQDEIVRQELEKGEAKMKKRTWMVLVPSGALAAVLLVLFVVSGGLRLGYQGRLKGSTDMIDANYKTDSYEPYYMNEGKAMDFKAIAKGGKVESPAGMMEQSVIGSTRGDMYSRTSTQSVTSYAESISGREAQRPERSEFELPLPQDGSVIIVAPTLPATADSEKIIRTGIVQLEVEDGKIAYQKALAIAQELGGYIASSNFYKNRDNQQSGTITIRVPKDKFAPALERFGTLGKVENVSTDSRDVTQEYANLQSQLDVAMVAYKKMLEALQKKQVTIPEAMRIESELTPVLRRVQDLKNHIEALNNVISYPTITLNFHEAAVSVKFLKESTRYIKESLITAGIAAVRIAAAAIPIAVVVLIVGGILFAVVLWVIRLSKRG